MKKFRFFSFASAMLLASAAGMVSCSSDSIEPTGGPGVTGQVVKTQFAINIPYGGNSSTNQAKKVTRMTDEMTQQSNNFRGISDIVLLTFSGNPETAGTINADKPISIGTDGNAYSQDTYRRLYRDIEIPVGTSNMIFYGRASRTTENNFQAGKITDKGEKKTLANISHELTAISSEANFATDVDAKAIITALNNIANAKVTDDDGTDYTWANIGNASPLPTWLTAHEKEFLKTRYNKFTALKAGSKTSVVAFINNLKTALAGETTTGEPISADKKLTKEIYNQCVAALTTINGLNEFPRNLNLPDGVATLTWISGESKFAYNAPETEFFGTGNSIKYNKICYPAELSYFVSTKTMVSDKDMSNLSEFPSYTDWTKNTQSGWGGKTSFAEKAVENSTRTVGLKDPVQYSVAVLKSTVRCNTATLEDNAHAAGGFKDNQSITVNDNSFPVTGILIGGQPASVDWKYEPASSETFENTIYDNVMNGSPMYAKYASEVPTVGNYTLVFDNKKTGAENSVYVAIELTNNSGQAFYGKDGIIQKDTKFYLIGILDPNKEGLPKPAGVNRVFVQDYVTTANFKIKDLKSAYNCIPDLRTSGINVGLAVDLDWKSGITFDVDI